MRLTRRQFIYQAAAIASPLVLPLRVLAAGTSAIDFARSLYSVRDYWSGVTSDEITTAQYLDTNLAALIKDNYARDDFDSALDYDPLLQAQDWDNVTTHFTMKSETAKDAVIEVAIENEGQPTTIGLHLANTAAGWRLSDIVTADGSSLVDELKQLNAAPPGGDGQ